MKIHLLSFCLIVFFSMQNYSVFAQKHPDTERPIGTDRTMVLKGRTNMVILLQEADAKVVEDLKKNNNNAGLEYYNQIIQNYNEIIKKTVEEIWGSTLNIEYKTIEELKTASETVDEEKYLVLYTLFREEIKNADNSIASFYYYNYPIKAKELKTVPSINENKTWYIPHYEAMDIYSLVGDWDYSLHIKPLEDFIFKPYRSNLSKVEGAIEFDMTHWIEPENFYIFSLSYLKSKYDAIISDPKMVYETFYSQKAPQLKDLILIIPEEYFANDNELMEEKGGNKLIELTLNENEFKSAYQYDYKIVNADEFNSTIAEKKSGFAYMIHSISVRSAVSMVIMDASTGKMILVSKPKDKKNNYFSNYILADHLATVLDYINQ